VLSIIFTIAVVVYQVFVLVGIWNAANKYQGPTIWAVLAKIAVVLGAILLALSLLFVILALGQV